MDPMTEALQTPASFFDALAPDYDALTDIGSRLVRERPFFHVLVHRYGIRTAIDAGCGTGVHAILLSQLGAKVTAVDVSAEMLRLARVNAAHFGVKLRTIKSDVASMSDLVRGPVDAIVCLGNTLAHVHRDEELAAAFSGFRRLLAPEGIAVIHVLNYAKIRTDRESLLSTRDRDGVVFERSYRPSGAMLEFRTTIRRASRTDEQSVLHRPWRAEELVKALGDAGFGATTLTGGIDLKPYDPAGSGDLFLFAAPAPR